MLDNKDIKILGEIINNARIPNNQLSKKINISREIIDYHIKKLEKNKIILGYQARINLTQFSSMAYHMLIKLKNYNEKQEKKLIEELKELKYTHFIGKISGNYDLILGFTIKELNDLKNYLDSLYENHSEIIEKHELFTILKEIKDNFAPIIDKNNNLDITSMIEKTHNYNLDIIDKTIIKELTKNAKINAVELSQKLNITSAAIAYRIKQLEKNNIILGYRTIIDLDKFDKQFYYVFFNIENPNKYNNIKIKNELKSNTNIIFSSSLAGNYSYLCLFTAKDNHKFNEKLRNFQNKTNIIKNISTYTFLQFLHHNYIPNGFLDNKNSKDKKN
ncbi:MAG: Lrp/AsnC family transcriptional regulator [Nanoarchaeota archaeon]|nr:Lrp/AsnC family transcriptional regulator [Nanoarchaeota archaeon]